MNIEKFSKDLQEFESLLLILCISINSRKYAIEEEIGHDFAELPGYFNQLNMFLPGYPDTSYRVYDTYTTVTSTENGFSNEFYIPNEWINNPRHQEIENLFNKAEFLLKEAQKSGLSPRQVIEKEREIKELKRLKAKYPDEII